MKIAYLTADFGVPVFGTKGASVHVNGVVTALVNNGHEVLVLTPRLGDIPEDHDLFRVIKIPLEGSWPNYYKELKSEEICQNNRLQKDIRNLMYASWLQHQAGHLFKQFKPDFIYERYSLFGTAGLHLSQEFQIPLILEVNAPLVEEQQQQRGLSLPKVAQATQKQIFNEANHIIVVSDWLKDYVIKHNVKNHRITVMPNGVDPVLFSPSHASSKTKDSFVIGYVGSMKNWHGLPSVLKAINLLKDKVPNLRLQLVGDGPETSNLKKLANEMELNDIVHFIGKVPHNEIPKWVGNMDVAIAPFAATVSEYFSPVKLFEYMAMACPIIAARINQTSKIIEPERTGWLYSPGNHEELAEKLLWMMKNKERIKQIGLTARETALKNYTWKHNADRVITLATEELNKTIDENTPLTVK